ncbi:MAG: hypothetical protein WCK78_12190 [Paludibacter sp.]
MSKNQITVREFVLNVEIIFVFGDKIQSYERLIMGNKPINEYWKYREKLMKK